MTVYLVGAGPGDPGLLTVRGADVLGRADVVVYDRLVHPSLLDLAPPAAQRVYAGKAPGAAEMDQSDINALLVEQGRAGKEVVRLKGGDPFVFGRGGEEALACAREGIPFEVVPGVSSAVAGPAYLGVPVTHRGLSSSFAVVTGTKASGDVADLGVVARSVETLVILMAAGRLEEICDRLVEAGRSASEPAALVQWATTSRQRSVTSTIGSLPQAVKEASLGAPATLVVGSVVALADQLNWFATGEILGEDELLA
ncbi:MAG: uroporphyrinogen-III C-methyltransferase [Actinomycetota bacterium]